LQTTVATLERGLAEENLGVRSWLRIARTGRTEVLASFSDTRLAAMPHQQDVLELMTQMSGSQDARTAVVQYGLRRLSEAVVRFLVARHLALD
jgi:hypothetical protein